MTKIDKEDLESYRTSYLTVGKLRRILSDPEIEDDALVMIERVNDVYYEEHNWGVYLKDSYLWDLITEKNNKLLDEIDKRKKGELPTFTSIEDPAKYIIDDEERANYQDQYHPAFSVCMYNDEKELFIKLHY